MKKRTARARGVNSPGREGGAALAGVADSVAVGNLLPWPPHGEWQEARDRPAPALRGRSAYGVITTSPSDTGPELE